MKAADQCEAVLVYVVPGARNRCHTLSARCSRPPDIQRTGGSLCQTQQLDMMFLGEFSSDGMGIPPLSFPARHALCVEVRQQIAPNLCLALWQIPVFWWYGAEVQRYSGALVRLGRSKPCR